MSMIMSQRSRCATGSGSTFTGKSRSVLYIQARKTRRPMYHTLENIARFGVA